MTKKVVSRHRDQDRELIKVGETKDFSNKALLKEIPAQYLKSIENNPDIKECCRDTTDNYTVEYFKTEDEQTAPSMVIFTCTTCGCRHFRTAAGPGKL